MILGYLRVFGTSLREWCIPHGVTPTNAKSAATGAWNGPKAKALRQKMIDEVGEETFQHLYPRLVIAITEPDDVKPAIDGAVALAGIGVTFKASELRRKLGFSDPEKGTNSIKYYL